MVSRQRPVRGRLLNFTSARIKLTSFLCLFVATKEIYQGGGEREILFNYLPKSGSKNF